MSFQLVARLSATSLAVGLLLAACGGGSSGEPPAAGLTLKGTAATGAAMSGATVTAKCATGTQTGRAGTSGAFTLVVEGGALPCLLEAQQGSTTLYSMASGSGAEAVANITPITHTVVAKALGDESKLAEAFAAPTPAALQAAATELSAALATVRVALTGVADYSQNPFTTVFTAAHTGSDGTRYPGDTFDQQLDRLEEKLTAAQANLEQLVNAIVTSQGGGASAPATNVVGVLTPPANSACPNARSGQYVVASQRGSLETGTYNAATNQWTNADGSTRSTAIEESTCQLVVRAADGVTPAIRVALGDKGIGIWRDVYGNNTDFGLVFPLQGNTLADLAGNWNMVAFDRDDTASTPAFGFGKATVNANGTWSWTTCPTSNGTATCGSPETESPFTVSNGKFTNADGQGYLYKAPNGTKLYVQSFGEGYGMVVATPPHNIALPSVGSSVNFFDVSGSFTSASAITSATLTISSVDAANSTYTRSDGQVRSINKPAEGMSYRAATEATATAPARGANIYMHAKGLVTVYGREKKDANSFVGFSIGR